MQDSYEKDPLFNYKLVRKSENSDLSCDNPLKKSDYLSLIEVDDLSLIKIDDSKCQSPPAKSYDIETAKLNIDRVEQSETDQSIVRLPNHSPMLSNRNESFSSISTGKTRKIEGKIDHLRKVSPKGKSPKKKRPILQICTPGKRKYQNKEDFQILKKIKVGVADCTQKQPDFKTSFGEIMERFGGQRKK